MENDVAIRVRDHSLSMRNPHPPQRDMVTGPEGVDVETLADPDHAHTLPSGKPIEKT
jgi:hypothetical protein